ncbi:hypothetical protein FZI85_20910 [Mycobacterium sp. CBMA293]|nr:hypothetical protein [Mycolicibacterium sp. CBMA 360]MUL62811.1 hypothetical protein [Mycolicibacterium sp. CBMA 335]MUL69598.1 hypothetical protein [Mycolicibacterium sp. CBMA 311]MUL96925.1 hypothetical protein [Mycolicibacterium sp. CBMA 230]MUM07952.1 hypothetical protein [Mycolicibacterium sp. CBMA 213]MUM13470.1 hypothetical protein [Mycolicibacterium sp. CBMA 293]MUM31474.1 hypothetical protein [Mycolicibacterium sp. CBMA 361]
MSPMFRRPIGLCATGVLFLVGVLGAGCGSDDQEAPSPTPTTTSTTSHTAPAPTEKSVNPPEGHLFTPPPSPIDPNRAPTSSGVG